jgi:hypothetical protein
VTRPRAGTIVASLFGLGVIIAVLSAVLFALPRASVGAHYVPLASSTFAPTEADARQGFALGTAAAALLLIAGSAGWRLGR